MLELTCPVPIAPRTIQLAHGGGGRAMRSLIESVFRPAFANARDLRHDSAVLALGPDVAFTTDGYVVKPLFFPGGDIGKLAVFGTVNDLAMAGARPRFLSAGFILEEGLPLETLERVVRSMADAARATGVEIVTGDTKVVDRGKGDGIFITTSGVGSIPDGVKVAPSRVEPGDAVLVSGDLGRHGIAILSVREGLAFEGAIESDCAPLHELVAGLIDGGVDVHCLRDLTRGGLVSALNEIASDGNVGVAIDETVVPVSEPVAAACEILGLDPLHVANEGRLVAFVAARDRERALAILRAHPLGRDAALIGEATDTNRGAVLARGRLGGTRLLDLLSGEQLPRIC
jgi:hydrogenase expression/formation protein HypE